MKKRSNNKIRIKNKNILKRAAVLSVLMLLCAALIFYAAYAYEKTGTIIPTAELIDGRPTVRFVDVGQGDCTLITYMGDAVLVDAGPQLHGNIAADYIRMYAPCIDYMIITHPHEDHMGGAAEILRRTDVENLVILDTAVGDEFYESALEAAEQSETNVIRLDGETEFDTDGGAIHIDIFGSFDLDCDNLNNASLITKVTVGSTTVLLTGDAEEEEEAFVLQCAADRLDCDILKLGHHGSGTSTSQAFLDACSPEICVVSCEKNNSYGHPSPPVVQRVKDAGAVLYRTDKQGTVVLRGEK